MSDFPGGAPDAFPGGPTDGASGDGGHPDITLPTYAVLLNGVTSATIGEANYVVKQGDTLPSLQATLYNASGLPIDLSAAIVTLKIRDVFGAALKVDAICTIVSELDGTISYDWVDADVDTGGIYYLEFEIIFSDLKEITVPSDGYLLLEMVAELG